MTELKNALRARYAVAGVAVLIFLAVSTLTRIGLMVVERVTGDGGDIGVFGILAVGFGFDLICATFVAVPFALLALIIPDSPRGRQISGVLMIVNIAELIFALLFIAVAEALFWNEFSARFNFIAVDYLIYTRETIGNIRESYPVGLLMAGLVALTAVLTLLLSRPVWRRGAAPGGRLRVRFVLSAALVLLPAVASLVAADAVRDRLPSSTSRELSENGAYEFVRAFASNSLDYHTFYATLDESVARDTMRNEFAIAQSDAVFTQRGANPLERRIVAQGERKPINIVLVTMESFGAELTESLGGRKGLSPNLDQLGREGLFFSQMYATGTRTVRGLEAISLSLPPTPGQAVLKRKDNKGFQTLGSTLKPLGYDPIFFYGGFSYFDNMRDFFGGNGYEVVDRTAVSKSQVQHETIWGMCDEDLFGTVLREIDARQGSGRQVFAHVMTASNHRPFTYPDGRVSIPSGTSRDGAASYSDWAIGDFIRKAKAKPWFNNTMFVFVADHTSQGRGRSDLPMENYHIPFIVYAPGFIAPARIDTMVSQIDVAPTLLALLNISYTSTFFGQDALTEGRHHQRALFSNYVTVGHVEDGVLVELGPKRTSRVLDAATGQPLAVNDPRGPGALAETIAHYEVAADVLKRR